jgi:hypothetical protein
MPRKCHETFRKKELEKTRLEKRLRKRRRKPVSGTVHLVKN